MSRKRYWGVTVALCGVAIWLGSSLGKLSGVPQSAANIRIAARPLEAVKAETIRNESAIFRRAASRCDTQALWQWMRSCPVKYGEAFRAAAGELLDREGPQAIRSACDLENPEERRPISEALLAAYSTKDLWEAFEIYKELRARFDPKWGDEVVRDAFESACGISADRLIKCMNDCPGTESAGQPYLARVPFAEGFDFERLATYLSSLERPPRFIPNDLLGFWTGQRPLEAVSWYLGNRSKTSYVTGGRGEALIIGDFDNGLMNSIIESEGSAADRIAALKLVPEDNRKELWAALLSGRWAAGESGVLNPKFLEIAEVMTGREDFLATKLLETRGFEELDSSWTAVPSGERAGVIRECLARWEKEEPTEFGRLARDKWQDWLKREWR